MRTALLLFFLLTLPLRAQTPEQRVDALFAEWNRNDAPGYSIAVIQDGKTVLAKGYGIADLEREVKITPRSVFDIGSTSKQFTAASILLLEQEGKLSLDDPVRKWIPELPDYGKPLTIRHLVHHTSGVRDYLDLAGLAGNSFSNDYSDEETLSWITRQKALNFNPGDEYLYSNSGYYLLGQIVERASGMSLRNYAAKKIFEPLGMTNTHFHDDPNEIVKHRAIAYSPREKGFRIDMSNYHVVGDGAVYTTTEDLAKWDANFYDPKVGGQALLDALHRRGKLNNGEEIDYASGLQVRVRNGLRVVSHGGGWAGYRTQMTRYPEKRLTVIAISNHAEADPQAMALAIADIYLDRPKEEKKAEPSAKPAPAVTVTDADMQKVVGQYYEAKEGYFTVEMRDGKLFAIRGASPYELRAIGPNQYAAVGPPVVMTFAGDTVDITLDGKPFAIMKKTAAPPVLSASDLGAYTGDYQSEEIAGPHRLRVHEGKLLLRAGFDRERQLRPRERDVFQGPGVLVRFTRNADGAVTGYRLDAGRVKGLQFARGKSGC